MPEKKEKDRILKPQRSRDETFGCKDWVEDVVEPMGPRGELLWRHLTRLHRFGGPAEELHKLKRDWARISPHVKDWK